MATMTIKLGIGLMLLAQLPLASTRAVASPIHEEVIGKAPGFSRKKLARPLSVVLAAALLLGGHEMTKIPERTDRSDFSAYAPSLERGAFAQDVTEMEAQVAQANYMNAHELIPAAELLVQRLEQEKSSVQSRLGSAQSAFTQSHSKWERLRESLTSAQKAPWETELKDLASIEARSIAARDQLKATASSIERRSAYMSGVAGVYNPETKQVEWKIENYGGVAGVYNPETRQVEWNSGYKTGVAGVYNSDTKQVEWKTQYMAGIAGVYNPETRQVEWKSASSSGVAGVYNPDTKQVEWNIGYKTGVTGFFNPKTRQVEWAFGSKSGVVILDKGDGKSAVSAYSFYGSGEK